MVDGVGSATTGSLRDFDLYNKYYSQYLAYNKDTGGNLSFEAFLRIKDKLGYFNQQLENFLETGNSYYGDGVSGNTINDSRHVVNGNKTIYQSQDEETYYEFDFENGTYRVIQGSDEAAAALGFGSNTVDTLSMGYKSATATDYTFGNLDDGQDSSTSYMVSGYGNVAYVQQEFDVHYILNALLMNPDDPQYQIAAGIFNDLTEHLTQWCSQADIDALDQVAAQYGVESSEYKEKLKEVILANLDQANEWVENHAHVEYTPESAVLQAAEEEQAAQNAAEAQEEAEGTAPEYDKNTVIQNAGIFSDYQANRNWTGSWRTGDGNEEAEIAESESITYATKIIDALISSLQAEVGAEWTDEMSQYAQKVKNQLLTEFVVTKDEGICDDGHVKRSSVWGATDCKGWKGRKKRAVVSVKNLTDLFLSRFDSICINKGKTDAEVEAEKKAAEEKAAKEKSGYQTLYNMDFDSAADDAGVPDTVTAVPTGSNQFSEIQAKAEQDILDPLKAKIKSQMSGKGIDDADLDELLENATTDALANPNKWATTTNNYTYTINSNVLIDLFKDAVKTGIKAKGYEFLISPCVVESVDMMICTANIEDFKEDSSVVSLLQNDKDRHSEASAEESNTYRFFGHCSHQDNADICGNSCHFDNMKFIHSYSYKIMYGWYNINV